MHDTRDTILQDTDKVQARVRESLRNPLPSLTQLRTDIEGSGPSFGMLLMRRLRENARRERGALGRIRAKLVTR